MIAPTPTLGGGGSQRRVAETTLEGTLAIAPAVGHFTVEGGDGWRRLARRLLRFPAPGRIPVRLDIAPGPPDVWTRRMGERVLTTTAELVDGVFVERFGPIAIAHSIDRGQPGRAAAGVELRSTSWALGAFGRSVALPHRLRPRIGVSTVEVGSELAVSVRIADARDRLIVAYRGRLRAVSR